MATDNLGGLFTTPEQYQQAQNNQAMARAAEMAQMTPGQQANAGLRMAGYQMGNAIGGALGAEDPQMKAMSAVQSIMKDVDQNNPQSMMQAAVRLQSVAPKQAAQLAQYARAAQEQIAKTGSESLLGKTIISGKYTPESVSAYAKTGDVSNLSPVEKLVKPKEEFIAKAVELGFGEKPKIGEYSQSEVIAINKALLSENLSTSRAKATVVNTDLAGILREVSAKEDAKGKQETWAKAGDKYRTDLPMLTKLERVQNDLPTTFTGAFADTALGFGKALSGLGVKVNEKKLSDTEYMNGVSSAVLQTIAKNFPGSQAIKEMEELKKSKFNSTQQMETVSRILQDLHNEVSSSTSAYEKLAKMPQAERYGQDMNMVVGDEYKRRSSITDLTRKVQSGTASKAEALQLKQLRGGTQ